MHNALRIAASPLIAEPIIQSARPRVMAYSQSPYLKTGNT